MPRPADPSPNDEFFRRKEASRAMLEAVEQLAQAVSRSADEMELLTMGQLARLAQETYGQQLPSFWETWIDWHRPGQEQPMGEL